MTDLWYSYASRPAERVIEPSPIEIGKTYTIVSTREGDRSYSDCVWEVVNFNAVSVEVKWTAGDSYWATKAPRILTRKNWELVEWIDRGAL